MHTLPIVLLGFPRDLAYHTMVKFCFLLCMCYLIKIFIQAMNKLLQNYHNAWILSLVWGLLCFPGLLCCSLYACIKAKKVIICILVVWLV